MDPSVLIKQPMKVNACRVRALHAIIVAADWLCGIAKAALDDVGKKDLVELFEVSLLAPR